MLELPEALQNRFHLYLNILPYLDIFALWGFSIGGILLLLIAVTRAALNLSSSKSNKPNNHNSYNYGNVTRSGVYMPCEEKYYETEKNCIRIEDDYDLDDVEGNFALENEPALSDIEDISGNDEPNSSADDQSWTEVDNNKKVKMALKINY